MEKKKIKPKEILILTQKQDKLFSELSIHLLWQWVSIYPHEINVENGRKESITNLFILRKIDIRPQLEITFAQRTL